MRKFMTMLSLAAAAGVAIPAMAEAQWDIIRRGDTRTTTTRGDIYGDVYDRDSRTTSSRVPPGHMPPPGYCRVWVDGRPPGQQPPVTDCGTAERNRYRYGSNARVIYGDRTTGRSAQRYERRDDRYNRVYNRTINGRQCRVVETWDNGRRVSTRNVCENDRYDTRGVYDGRVYDDRVYSDDDSDGRGNGKKGKKVKVKHNKGKGRG